MNLLINNFNLSEDFLKIYVSRYKNSMNFIDEIIRHKEIGLKNEFFASHLAMNELFSALRDELRSLLLFKEGHPISRWRDSRINPNITPEQYELVYENTLKSFDLLLGKAATFIEEQKPEEKKERNYWSIYSSILFLINNTKTQDATLLTTAILNEADYFVTNDEVLIKSARDRIKKEYNLSLIKASAAFEILKKKNKEGRAINLSHKPLPV